MNGILIFQYCNITFKQVIHRAQFLALIAFHHYKNKTPTLAPNTLSVTKNRN